MLGRADLRHTANLTNHTGHVTRRRVRPQRADFVPVLPSPVLPVTNSLSHLR